jgi:hypothetical protein
MTAKTARVTQAGKELSKWLFAAGQFFWPWLEDLTPGQKKKLEDDLTRDEARIEALDFGKEPDAALEEARRLADSETERRRGTDQKAAIYLPLVAALIPLVLTLVSALWEKKAGGAPNWLNMVLLGLAVAYTASAGHWAFRELKVSVSHEPGLSDFEKSWAVPHPSQTLTRRLLLHTRRNSKGVNWKVTCIKMAHEYLLRAFLTFSLLLLVNIGWYLAGPLVRSSWYAPAAMLITPKQAIAAMGEVDDIAARLKISPAWLVLDKECQRRTADGAPLVVAPEAGETITNIPAALRPATNDAGAVQNIRFMCGSTMIGQTWVWSIPSRLVKLNRTPGLPNPLAVSATDTVVKLTKFWPPSGAKENPKRLPPMLLQQVDLRRDADGRPIALVITAIERGVITLP